MSENQPTLEDLRDAATPAWLWDAARARLVWANKPGVQAFDAQTLFDLIDRSFDPSEAGVARIVALCQTLHRGQAASEQLHFPSTGNMQDFQTQCWLHRLADGRDGVLVVAQIPRVKISEPPQALATSVMAALPFAVIVMSSSGDFLHGNAAAQSLLTSDAPNTLAGLLQSDERAKKLLQRLSASALVTTTEHAANRDLKCVFSKLADGTFSLLLEDVTERRALENDMLSRQIAALDAKVAMAAQVAPAPTPIPAQAFESLGKSIENAVKAIEPTPVVESTPVGTPIAPLRKAPFVPEPIRVSLERTGRAILVGREGVGLFATQAAIAMLHYGNIDQLINDSRLWRELFATTSGAALNVNLTSAATEVFNCERACIPWLNGPADQFILSALAKAGVSAPQQFDETPATLPPAKAEVIAETPKAETKPEVSAPSKSPAPTEAAIAYEELKSILDVASDGIVTLDKEGLVLSFSAGAEAIFGLHQAEVIGKHLSGLLKAESRKVLRDYLAGFNGPGLGSVFNDGREVLAETREGNGVPIFISVSRLQSPQSKAALCAVVRDITTWKKTEQDLRVAKDQAEMANRQKSDFLARISHELRTPLNAIMGFSEVMRSERFGEIRNDKYRGYANDIHTSGAHLLALINDLLDLSKVEAGKLELNFTAESIVDATEQAMRLLQEEARTARVLLRTAFPAKLPRVVADHRALRQILLNLVSNAVKYTNAGGQVVVSATMETDGSLVVRVKDTGIGMTDKQLEEALQPFTRVETPDRERQGTGLGLPLTKALTEANRAKLKISSAPNQGTTADIVFPGTRVLAE